MITVTQLVSAQVPQPEYRDELPRVAVIAKSFGDSVVIRWAPDSPELWQLGNKYGYFIERKTVVRNGEMVKDISAPVRLTESPVLPMELDLIKPLADIDNYAGVVAQAIYGETFQLITQEENDMVSFFNRAADLQNRFSFALFSADVSIHAARAHGLTFTDKNIRKDEKYVYRIYPAFDHEIMPYDTGFTLVDAGEVYDVPAPIDVWAVFGDRMAEISWDKKLQENVFTSYIIERSGDGGKTFRRMNRNPVINLANIPDHKVERNFYIDSLPQNDVMYYYRVRGITSFGETGPPSDTVGGRGMKSTPFIHPMITGYDLLVEGIKIRWEIMEKYGYDVHGFRVKKSRKANGSFEDLIDKPVSSDAREFTDKEPYAVNYYKVCALNERGEEFCSFPSLVQLPDSIPPEPPVNLQGTIDSAGMVRLTWDACTEADFQSYRVYRGNRHDGEFIRINTSAVAGTFYTDTVPVNTLNEEVFYRFTSVDNRYNESDFSEVLTVKKPDIVPPVSPVIRSARYSDQGIRISWLPVPSADVVKYQLYRKAVTEEAWTLMKVFPEPDTVYTYTDPDIREQQPYDYLVLAVDDAGLESEPGMPVRVSAGLFDYPSIEKFSARAYRQEKSIALKWKYNRPEAKQYYIYKSVNDNPPGLYKMVEGHLQDFTDTNVIPGNTYGYRIQAGFAGGNRTPLSEPVNVKY